MYVLCGMNTCHCSLLAAYNIVSEGIMQFVLFLWHFLFVCCFQRGKSMYHYTSSGKCPSLPQISAIGSTTTRIPLPPPRNPPPAPPTQRQLSYTRDPGRSHYSHGKSRLVVSSRNLRVFFFFFFWFNMGSILVQFLAVVLNYLKPGKWWPHNTSNSW